MKAIDLNCDMGELPQAIADGTQESLMSFVTSVNIACGGHAGDEPSMRATIQQAMRRGLAMGAHPSYPDRANFGRLPLKMPEEAITQSVWEQVAWLAKVAADCGAQLNHVKPHGALYNQAAGNPVIARAIAKGVSRWRQDVVLVGFAGSIMLDVFRQEGFAAAGEAFADRHYEASGELRPRNLAHAMIGDAREASLQALSVVQQAAATAYDGTRIAVDAQTICIHGDTPGAAGIAAGVALALRGAGIKLCPL